MPIQGVEVSVFFSFKIIEAHGGYTEKKRINTRYNLVNLYIL